MHGSWARPGQHVAVPPLLLDRAATNDAHAGGVAVRNGDCVADTLRQGRLAGLGRTYKPVVEKVGCGFRDGAPHQQPAPLAGCFVQVTLLLGETQRGTSSSGCLLCG